MVSLSHRISIRIIPLKKLSGRSKAVRYNIRETEERRGPHFTIIISITLCLTQVLNLWAGESLKDFAMNFIRETILRVRRKFLLKKDEIYCFLTYITHFSCI